MKMMKIMMNLEKLKNLNLTPNDYVYLVLLNQKQKCYFKHNIFNLESLGYIKESIDEDGKSEVILRTPAKVLLKSMGVNNEEDIEAFVERYRALFPTGVKTAGLPVRGDKQGCIKKMKAFKAKYDYTDEEILEAVRVYLAIKKKDNWRATTTAHYFIEKDGVSILASMCEDIRSNGSKMPSEDNNFGTAEVV